MKKEINKKLRQPVRTAPPKERTKDFSEVSSGYDKDTMLIEAARCLDCKHAPCVKGCPVEVDIPRFIMALKNNDPSGANRIIKENNSLPAVCGRVCPQELQCEKVCVRVRAGGAVAIGALERYAADFAIEAGEKPAKVNRKLPLKVAVVGSGPTGLAAAGELASAGASVTVFEAFHREGGVLVYGIPEFRLPKTIVRAEVDALKELGVEFRLNTVIGKTFSLDTLLADYDFVVLGSGAGLPVFLGIKGEILPGVYSANEFLTRTVLMRGYQPTSDTPIKRAQNVVVVGAGNVAMDAARTALRLGAQKVTLLYRRGREEMPARQEEILHAEEEGVEFRLLS
ncbi:MAG: FAD-dependent oxidoreductase, partial [Clostridia bacterium]